MGENPPKRDRRMSLAASNVNRSNQNSRDSQRRMSSISFMSSSPLNDSAEETSTPRTVNTHQWFFFSPQLC